MKHEIQRTAYLPIKIDGLTLVQELECDVTMLLEDDGCGDLSWSVVHIDVENQDGTGWVRFRRVREAGTLTDKLGNELIKEAYKDPLLDEVAAEEWRAIQLEDAA